MYTQHVSQRDKARTRPSTTFSSHCPVTFLVCFRHLQHNQRNILRITHTHTGEDCNSWKGKASVQKPIVLPCLNVDVWTFRYEIQHPAFAQSSTTSTLCFCFCFLKTNFCWHYVFPSVSSKLTFLFHNNRTGSPYTFTSTLFTRWLRHRHAQQRQDARLGHCPLPRLQSWMAIYTSDFLTILCHPSLEQLLQDFATSQSIC
jgi:hypothetical protein